MENRVFLEHYRICADANDAPYELGRSGAAINYKAIDLRSKQRVAVQLIPLASIESEARKSFEDRARTAQKLDHVNIARVLEVGVDHEFAVVISEFFEGEPTDAWVTENGPMSIEAALRVGLQGVRALGAASFFALSHRALQPSNILIVPGASPDGGWPFVKLLNFGLAGAESYVVDAAGRVVAPLIAPQFASPEQLQDAPLDFRSEVFSLAATICFLLTGAVSLGSGNRARKRLRRLPELRRLPRRFRRLMGSMLSEKPENRPQDPVALEHEMRDCLTEIERRQSIRRKLGIPNLVALPRWTTAPTPAAQILRGAIAFVLLLLVGAGFAAVLLPDSFHTTRPAKEIGVPIGVSEPASTTHMVQNETPPSTASAGVDTTPQPAAENGPTHSPAAASITNTEASAQIAAAANSPAPRAAAAEEKSSFSDNPDAQTAVANARDQASSSPRKDDETPNASTRNSRLATRESVAAQRARFANASPRYSRRTDFNAEAPPYRGSFRARLIGTTADGRPILRLPSGRVVIAVVGVPVEGVPPPPPPRRVVIRQPDFDDAPAPWQPFDYSPRD